jgi:hypothetical protein
MAKAPDRWHRWLMDTRFGGDPAARERLLTKLLYPVRDTVLDKAELQPEVCPDLCEGQGGGAAGVLPRAQARRADQPLAAKIGAFYESLRPPGPDPMVDFDERDLVRHAELAEFADVSLELRVTVKNGKRPVSWEDALRMAVNPLVPPLGEVLDRVLSAPEIAEFTAHVKPLVESGSGRERQALAYLAAAKD